MTDPGATPDGSFQIHALEDALLAIDRVRAGRIIRESCTPGSPLSCIENMIVPALEDVGTLWENGDVALSQVYMSGRICEEIVDTMLPAGDPRRVDQPPMAIAVLEDHHTLGKRILLSVLRAGGYEIMDFGQGVPVDELAARTIQENIKILLISTLMLPAALRAKEAIGRIKENGHDVKVIVGGAPFNFDPQLWKEVGADAMGRNASETIEIVRGFAGGMK